MRVFAGELHMPNKYYFRKIYSAFIFSVNFVIHGYTGPLQEGDDLILTCESDINLPLAWTFTPNGKKPKLISQKRTFHKYGTELSDAGEYTCTAALTATLTAALHHQSIINYDLSASVRVEVLKYVPDNNYSVEVFTHNITIGGSRPTTDTSVTDNRSSVEVFNHNIITIGSTTGVIISVIIVALVIALVWSCRKQTRFACCKYKLILLIFHLKPVLYIIITSFSKEIMFSVVYVCLSFFLSVRNVT